MYVTLTPTQVKILYISMQYFEDFTMVESEEGDEISIINEELDNAVESLDCYDGGVELSEKDITNLIVALLVYRDIIKYDIPVPAPIFNLEFSKEKIINSILALKSYLECFISNKQITIFELTPDTNLL